jgi:hypothetical protein
LILEGDEPGLSPSGKRDGAPELIYELAKDAEASGRLLRKHTTDHYNEPLVKEEKIAWLK